MSSSEPMVEHTTAMALEEKGHLQKSLRRFDMLFFTLCALVGLDTLGQVSGFGAQTFAWVVIIAVLFVLPYALLMAELGTTFTQEGGPYEWMKMCWGRFAAGVGSVLYWVTKRCAPKDYTSHRDRRVERQHPHHRIGMDDREHHVQDGLHLDLDRRRDRLASPR